MPNYFLDVQTSTATLHDAEGRSFPTLDAALYEARRVAIDLAGKHLRNLPGKFLPEAILIRDEHDRVLTLVNVKEVVLEALSTVPGTQITNAEGRSGVAIVVAEDHGERFAAAAAFLHRGYLVHEANTLKDAVDKLESMRPDHPMFRGKRPMMFAAIDEA